MFKRMNLVYTHSKSKINYLRAKVLYQREKERTDDS